MQNAQTAGVSYDLAACFMESRSIPASGNFVLIEARHAKLYFVYSERGSRCMVGNYQDACFAGNFSLGDVRRTKLYFVYSEELQRRDARRDEPANAKPS